MTAIQVNYPKVTGQSILQPSTEKAENPLSDLLPIPQASSSSASFIAIPIDSPAPITQVANASFLKLREEYVYGDKIVDYIMAEDFENATALLNSMPHIAAYKNYEGESLLKIAFDTAIEKVPENAVFLSQANLDFIYLLIRYHEPFMSVFISCLTLYCDSFDYRPIYIDLLEKELITPTNLLVEMIYCGSRYFTGGYNDRRYRLCSVTKDARVLAEILYSRMKSVDIMTVHRQLRSRCNDYNRDNMEHLNKLLGFDQKNVPPEFMNEGTCIIQ